MLQDTNCPKCNAPLDTAGRCTGCGFYTITTPVIFPHIAHVVTQPYPATQMTPAEIEGAQMAAVALLGKIDRLEAENKVLLDTNTRLIHTNMQLANSRVDFLVVLQQIAKFQFWDEEWTGTRILTSEDYERKYNDFQDAAKQVLVQYHIMEEGKP